MIFFEFGDFFTQINVWRLLSSIVALLVLAKFFYIIFFKLLGKIFDIIDILTGGKNEAEPAAEKGRDLAAEVERKLKAKKAAAEKRRNKMQGRVVDGDGARVTKDSGVGVYREQGASAEECMAGKKASAAPVTKQEPQLGRNVLAHGSLAHGVIMAEILGKPRSLKPYGED